MTATAFDVACPADTVAVGIHGVASVSGANMVRDLALRCAPLTIHGSPGAFAIGYGASTMTALSGGDPPVTTTIDDACPSGQVLRGLSASGGAWITAVQALCGDLGLVLVPAP